LDATPRADIMKVLILCCLLGATSAGRQLKPRRNSLRLRQGRDFFSARQYRQGRAISPAGVDFSNAIFDEESGKRCVIKEESISTLEKNPVLECKHKETEQCHYTYITKFTPTQEEVCEENFEKQCQITFKQQATNETIRKCYRPIEKVCNGQGSEICRTVYESSCTTKYVEKQPGKFVGDTGCEKLPVEVCGAGCIFEEGEEECHEKVVSSLVDVPEEVCDLNPQRTCRLQTKLVPKLTPQHQCTRVPREICHLRFSSPKRVSKPLITKWCLDDSPVVPGELYEDFEADLNTFGRTKESKPAAPEAVRTVSNVDRARAFNIPKDPERTKSIFGEQKSFIVPLEPPKDKLRTVADFDRTDSFSLPIKPKKIIANSISSFDEKDAFTLPLNPSQNSVSDVEEKNTFNLPRKPSKENTIEKNLLDNPAVLNLPVVIQDQPLDTENEPDLGLNLPVDDEVRLPLGDDDVRLPEELLLDDFIVNAEVEVPDQENLRPEDLIDLQKLQEIQKLQNEIGLADKLLAELQNDRRRFPSDRLAIPVDRLADRLNDLQEDASRSARPISILTSGDDDEEQFLGSFKTQEFADFVDFGNFAGPAAAGRAGNL